MWITQEALVKFERLVPGKHLTDMKTMVKKSAPVTHERGNRRYHDLVFTVHRGAVEDVDVFRDLGCDDCGHRGYTVMYDDFLHKEVRIPCPCQDDNIS